MELNNIKIEKKKIYDELSLEDINERKIFGGNPTGIINFSKVKYQWAFELYDLMLSNSWYPAEIAVNNEKKDYNNLSPAEKRMYDLVLSQLIFMDSCFKPGTEVLTENGWEKIEEIKEKTKIYQFDIKTKEITMDFPLRVIKKPFNNNIITLYNDYGNFLHESTFDHDILIRDNISEFGESDIVNPIKKIKISNLKVRSNRSFIRSGIKNTGSNNLTLHQKLLIAFQADGWFGYKSKKYTTIYFDLVKEYKIYNLKSILDNLGYEYKTTLQQGPERTRFTIKIDHNQVLSKTFNWIDFNNVNIDWIKLFLDELIKWDSSEVDGQFIYRTKIKENSDIVQILFTFANLSHNYNYSVQGIHCIKWRMEQNSLKNMGYKNSGKIKRKEELYNGLVYCFSMPKGTLIIRQNNNITITGNCQTNNLMDNINPYITAPEVNSCLSRQSFEESLHSKSYQVLADSISENTDEIYDMWRTDKKLSEKNSFIASIYIELSSGEITDEKLLLALFANQILEGIYFYAGFAAMYALGKSGKMLGTSQMIRFIQRDEITHLLLFQNMINSVRKERPYLFTSELEQKVRTMFRRAVELEASWGIYITQGQILGFTDAIITQYIQYLADRRLEAVGYKPEYNVKHPIPWVDGYASFNDQRANFFEAKILNYSKGSITFDDDF